MADETRSRPRLNGRGCQDCDIPKPARAFSPCPRPLVHETPRTAGQETIPARGSSVRFEMGPRRLRRASQGIVDGRAQPDAFDAGHVPPRPFEPQHQRRHRHPTRPTFTTAQRCPRPVCGRRASPALQLSTAMSPRR